MFIAPYAHLFQASLGSRAENEGEERPVVSAENVADVVRAGVCRARVAQSHSILKQE